MTPRKNQTICTMGVVANNTSGYTMYFFPLYRFIGITDSFGCKLRN